MDNYNNNNVLQKYLLHVTSEVVCRRMKWKEMSRY